MPLLAPKSDVDASIDLINAGDLAGAETRIRARLTDYPRDVNLQALLGALLVKLNRAAEAETLLRHVTERAPTFARPHEDLGFLLVQQGRAGEALPFLERATHIDPKVENVWFTLGKALAVLGRGAEADQAFGHCFALSPERRMMALAAEHQKEGRLEEAEHLYRQVLREHPRNVDAMRLLAAIAGRAGHADEAEQLLERAISIAPDFLSAILDLGLFAQGAGTLRRSTRVLRPCDCARARRSGAALPARSDDGAGRVHTRSDCGLRKVPRAETFARRRAARARASAQRRGPVQRSSRILRCVHPQRPDTGEAYWSLANLKTYRFSDEAVAEMEQRARGSGLTVQSEVNFLFALGKAWEDRGDYERAWAYYREGNTKQRGEVAYDPVQTETISDRIIAAFSGDFLASCADAGLADPAPIFILGLPRSGSTLLEQILASHSQVEGTSELPYLVRVATSLNRNRVDGINYPEAVRELRPRISARSAKTTCPIHSCTAARARRGSSIRCPTTSRTWVCCRSSCQTHGS